MPMNNDKPFVSAAFICEKVLREADSVVSAIRIVDTFYVSPATTTPAVKPAAGLQITLFVAVRKKRPEAPPLKHELKLVLHTPSGKPPEVENANGVVSVMEDPTIPFLFVAGEPDQPASMNFVGQVIIPVQEFGGYLFDVFLDGELTTQIPFRLLERKDGDANPSQTQ